MHINRQILPGSHNLLNNITTIKQYCMSPHTVDLVVAMVELVVATVLVEVVVYPSLSLFFAHITGAACNAASGARRRG